MKYTERLPEFFRRLFSIIKTALSQNLGWKVFSLIIGVCLWFVVINITNPKEIWSFSTKLTLSGLDYLTENHNVVVKNQQELEDTTITVKVRGNRLAIEELNRLRHAISATARLDIIYDFTLSGDVQTPIDIIFPHIEGISSDAFEVISIGPSKYATITLEEIVTEEKAVKVKTTGDVADGYVALSPEAKPSTVNLTGPKSKLAQIDAVVVETELNIETEDTRLLLYPKLLDRDLQEVTGVKCDASFIDVVIKVAKYGKVPIKASYVGEPADGYMITGMEVSPEYLEVVGSNDEVSDFNELRLTAINVAGLEVPNTISFNVRAMNVLPETVSIKNGTPNNVIVTINIEKIVERKITLLTSQISTGTIPPNLSYTISDTEISFMVRGAQSVVENLNENRLNPVVNMQNYGVGEHIAPIVMPLPSGVSLAGAQPSVRIVIGRTQGVAAENIHNEQQNPSNSERQEDMSADTVEESSENPVEDNEEIGDMDILASDGQQEGE